MLIQHSKPWITEADRSAVLSTLQSSLIATGEAVNHFEYALASYLGFTTAVTVSSGAVAIYFAIRALSLPPGSHILIPNYTCKSVLNAVVEANHKPLLCDVGPNWYLDESAVSQTITSDTSAIIVVHPFGIFADVKSLLRFGLPIIEDCCQCFSPFVGHIGALAVFSFNATKCLTTGEGGLIATSNLSIANSLDSRLSIGTSSLRLSDLQASLGISQLRRYPLFLRKRHYLAHLFLRQINKKFVSGLTAADTNTIYFRFPIAVSEGYHSLSKIFHSKGISVRRGVDTLLHPQLGLPDELFPNSLHLYHTTLSIPLYPALTADETTYLRETLLDVLV